MSHDVSRRERGRGRGRTCLRAAAAGLALALPGSLFLSSPAQAASTPPWDCDPYVGDNYVVSCFAGVNQDFWVYDAESDGRSAVVDWWTSYGASGECKNSGGYGTWKKCAYSMTVGKTVYWDHYTYDGDTGDWNFTSGTYQDSTGQTA